VIAPVVIAPVAMAPRMMAPIIPVGIAAECVSRLTAYRHERNSRGPGCHDPEQLPACADVCESLHSNFSLAPHLPVMRLRRHCCSWPKWRWFGCDPPAPVRATNAYCSGWFQLQQPPLPQAADHWTKGNLRGSPASAAARKRTWSRSVSLAATSPWQRAVIGVMET